jgi:hypothetical protein
MWKNHATETTSTDGLKKCLLKAGLSRIADGIEESEIKSFEIMSRREQIQTYKSVEKLFMMLDILQNEKMRKTVHKLLGDVFEPIILKKNFDPRLYYIGEQLGRGSYGEVFEAKRDRRNSTHGLPEVAAVKFVIWKVKNTKGEGNNEWRLFKDGYNFEHANIVQFFYLQNTLESNKKQAKLAIWMELCSTSLEDYIEDKVVSYDDIKHVLNAVVTETSSLRTYY